MGKAARKLSGAALAEFNAKHPRGPGGRFVKAGSAGIPSTPDVPSVPAPGRARARLGLTSKVDMPSAVQTLHAKRNKPVSGDREAVDAILAPMTHAQLDEVAREFGMDSFVRGTKQEKSRQLREGIVGARLDHDAIMRIDLGSPFKMPTREEAEAFFSSHPQRRSSLAPVDTPSPAPARPRTARAKLAPKPKPQSMEDRHRDLIAISGGVNPWADRQSAMRASGETPTVVDRLRSLTSVAEGRALIGGKSKAELLAIAEAVGISRPSGRTKQELIESITYATITGPGSHAMLRRLGNQGKA